MRRTSRRTRSRNTNSTGSNMSDVHFTTEQLPETIVEEESQVTQEQPKRRGRPRRTPIKAKPPTEIEFNPVDFDPVECLDRLDSMERKFFIVT